MTLPFCPIPPNEALQIVLETVPSAAPRLVPLLHAAGLRSAEDVRADRDYPPFDCAMIDEVPPGDQVLPAGESLAFERLRSSEGNGA